MHTSYNIWSRKVAVKNSSPEKKQGARVGRTPPLCESIAGMDSLPLPDLYLIDSRKLLKEVHRIRQLALAIPPSVEAHSAQQTVLDALWRTGERHGGDSQSSGSNTQRVRRQGEGADRSFTARSGGSQGHIVEIRAKFSYKAPRSARPLRAASRRRPLELEGA